MSSSKQNEPILFRGMPYALTAVLAERVPSAGAQVCSLSGIGAQGRLEASAFPDVDPRILRLTLPPQTSAGTYEGTLELAGRARSAKFQIDPLVELRLFPEQSRFSVVPGGEVTGRWHVLNNGNVTVDLPEVIPFGIFLQGGVERALRQAYVATPKEGQRRVDLLADSLAEAHGGLVKAKLTKGGGPLASGELRPLEATFHLPAKLMPGRTYTGNFELPGLSHAIGFDVTKSKGEPQLE